MINTYVPCVSEAVTELLQVNESLDLPKEFADISSAAVRPVHRKWKQTHSPSRSDLVESLNRECQHVFAWNGLPIHYHAMVDADDVRLLLKSFGKLHG